MPLIITQFVLSRGMNKTLSISGLLQHFCLIKMGDFWTEVKRIRSSKTCFSIVVDNLSTPESIVAFFADKYEDLYSCVNLPVI